MKRIKLNNLKISALLLAFAPFSVSAIDVPIADDAMVVASSTTFNYGIHVNLNVSGLASSVRWSYLYFNVANFVPAGTKPDDIEKAVLRLYPATVTTAGAISVFNVTGPWLEGRKNGAAGAPGTTTPPVLPEITNTNKPTDEGVPETTFTLQTTNADEFFSLDITLLVKEWLGGPPATTNFGIVLKPATGSVVNVAFDSKENTTNTKQPTLNVTLVKKRTAARGDLSMGTFTNGPTP